MNGKFVAFSIFIQFVMLVIFELPFKLQVVLHHLICTKMLVTSSIITNFGFCLQNCYVFNGFNVQFPQPRSL